MDSFPDPDSLRDAELKDLLDLLVAEEREVARTDSGSYKLHILHGKIDVVRTEVVRRRRGGDGPDGPGGVPKN